MLQCSLASVLYQQCASAAQVMEQLSPIFVAVMRSVLQELGLQPDSVAVCIDGKEERVFTVGPLKDPVRASVLALVTSCWASL